MPMPANSRPRPRRRLAASIASLLLLSTLVAATPARAQEVESHTALDGGPVSLGVGLGDPAAVDLKLWTSRLSGLDLGVGVNDFDDVLGLYGEFEFGLIDFWARRTLGLFYVGLGGAAGFTHSGNSLAAVVPVGLDFRFKAPLDLFIEGRPGVELIDEPPRFGLGGQVGLRYVF
jgi:hypothetical protein